MNSSLKDFSNNIKRVHDSRVHKVHNSYGVYDGYKYYRKNKPKDKKYVLTESQYFAITRKINNYLRELFIVGNDITFPYKMGRLELRKRIPTIKLVDNKVKTTLPIDWNRTLKLWYEDEESYKNKTLIKMEEKEVFKVYYNRTIANYNNKSFYQFTPNRTLKNKLKLNIKEGNVDAFLFNNM